LGSEEVLGHQLLEQTDSAPAGADGASDKCRVAQDKGGEFIEVLDWGFIEGAVFGEREDGEDDGEEACEGGEDSNPVREVGAKAGRISGVEGCAG
jgi:hypothetical protein